MNLTALALRRNRVTLVLVAVLVVSGVASDIAMPNQMVPCCVMRKAQIVTRLRSVLPAEIPPWCSPQPPTATIA